MNIVNITSEIENSEDNMPYRVFVYGTLKRGHGNSHLLREATPLGRSLVTGKYKLYDLGGFPAVMLRPAGEMVHILGEVYDVPLDTFQTLDMLEGHPDWYKRIKVATAHGKAWMYTFSPETIVRPTWREVTPVWRPSEEELAWLQGVGRPEESHVQGTG